MASRELTIAAAVRNYPGETVSGDAWQVDWYGAICRLAVIDGLGHGPDAARAADAARSALARQPELGPAQSVEVCHAALHGTRGAAMSIATVDVAAGRLEYTGVGNVEASLLQAGVQQRLITFRGIVGAALPSVRVFTFELQRGWLLVIHTDGIRARFNLETSAPRVDHDAQRLADGLLRDWGRETDDATVVVVREG